MSPAFGQKSCPESLRVFALSHFRGIEAGNALIASLPRHYLERNQPIAAQTMFKG